jgi:hypothetical protein
MGISYKMFCASSQFICLEHDLINAVPEASCSNALRKKGCPFEAAFQKTIL